jgi:hypothetical protein
MDSDAVKRNADKPAEPPVGDDTTRENQSALQRELGGTPTLADDVESFVKKPDPGDALTPAEVSRVEAAQRIAAEQDDEREKIALARERALARLNALHGSATANPREIADIQKFLDRTAPEPESEPAVPFLGHAAIDKPPVKQAPFPREFPPY